jgi:hypothetical protein
MSDQSWSRHLAAAALVLVIPPAWEAVAQGSPTFAIASRWTTGITSDSAGVAGIAVGDLDGDGVVDGHDLVDLVRMIF